VRVFVAGHRGLVGSAAVRALAAEGRHEILTAPREQLDLTDWAAVRDFFARERPEVVIDAAARVGGILDNSTRPTEFIRENLLIQTHLIHAAWQSNIEKFIFLGSSCIYPREAPQPLATASLMSGPLEPTNRAYATAKLAGIEMCRAYRAQHGFPSICVMPTNLYGPGDRFDAERSHVIPALITKFDQAIRAGAARVVLLGSGRALREFLFVDDLARALLQMIDTDDWPEIINVGFGSDISIAELARKIALVTGFEGEVVFDHSSPDGTPRKLLDSSVMFAHGWQPAVNLDDGLQRTWRWFLDRREMLTS
jgi:GDP-L-fucose synthase